MRKTLQELAQISDCREILEVAEVNGGNRWQGESEGGWKEDLSFLGRVRFVVRLQWI